MKVILYMAQSVNGLIAKNDDDTSFVSKEEWDSYSLVVRESGNLIIGRRTYEILIKQPEFKEFKDIKVVVVSRSDFETSVKNHFVVKSPKEAIERLKDFSSVIVAGGGILNLSFLKENLIDEIYIDTEPVVFSPGIKLFEGEEVEKRLELVGTKMFSKNGTQAHYKVIK